MTAATFTLQVDLSAIGGGSAQDGQVRIEPLANEAGTYPVVDPDTGKLYVSETYELGRTGSRAIVLPKPTDMSPANYQYRAVVTWREATGRYFKALPAVVFGIPADTTVLELGNLVDTEFVPPIYIPALLTARDEAVAAAIAAAASASASDTARAASVTAKNAAQTSAGNAATSETSAHNSQVAAALSETNAAASKTAADADAVATEADRVAVAADRVAVEDATGVALEAVDATDAVMASRLSTPGTASKTTLDASYAPIGEGALRATADSGLQSQITALVGATLSVQGAWSASPGSYAALSLVTYSGSAYVSNTAAVAADVPGVSSKWVALPLGTDTTARAGVTALQAERQDLGDDSTLAFAVMYAATREAAHTVGVDGTYFPVPKTSQEMAAFKEDADGSGWRWYLRYADTREVALGQRTDGTYFPTTLGGGLTTTVQLGDSLAANWGGGAGTPLVIPGRTVLDTGIGGQTSYQIAARQGGAPARLAADVVIPASGSVSVTLDRRLRSDTSTAVAVTIQGVAGTFTATGPTTGGLSDYTAGTFAPTASRAYPVPALAGTPLHTGFDARGYWPIIWYGRNNFKGTGTGYGGTDTAAQIVSDITRTLDYCTADARQHALVLSIPPWVGEETGTGIRGVLDAANAAIRDAFPTMWLDHSAVLRNSSVMTAFGFTPTSQDLTDIGNGLTPTSLRQSGDPGHWNANAYVIANAIVNAEYAARGWI